jgi:hypothetical protein
MASKNKGKDFHSTLMAADPTACRKALLKAGFTPLPAHGKKVLLEGWSVNCTPMTVVEATIIRWAEDRPYDRNSSVAAFNTPFVDIDVTHAPLAQWCYERLLKHCGLEWALHRVGLPPKIGVPFRLRGAPFRKRRLTFVDPDGVGHAIEVLSRGQQFVCYGKRDRKHAYEWHGGDLIATGRAGLPEIDEATADEFIKQVKEELARTAGFTAVRIAGSFDRPIVDQIAPMRPSPSWAWTPHDVAWFRTEALTKLPGTLGYEDWFQLACGLLAKDLATGPDCDLGRLLFFEWSYRHAETITTKTPETQWADVMRRGWKPDYVGPGTIVDMVNPGKPQYCGVEGLDNPFDPEVTEKLKVELDKLKKLKLDIQARQAAALAEQRDAARQARTKLRGWT